MEWLYEPVRSEEELQAYLDRIEDPEKRKEEEKRLRRLREMYLESERAKQEAWEKGYILD